MITINKNFQIDKIRILRDLDLLLKIRHQELIKLVKRKYLSNLTFSIAVKNCLTKTF